MEFDMAPGAITIAATMIPINMKILHKGNLARSVNISHSCRMVRGRLFGSRVQKVYSALRPLLRTLVGLMTCGKDCVSYLSSLLGYPINLIAVIRSHDGLHRSTARRVDVLPETARLTSLFTIATYPSVVSTCVAMSLSERPSAVKSSI